MDIKLASCLYSGTDERHREYIKTQDWVGMNHIVAWPKTDLDCISHLGFRAKRRLKKISLLVERDVMGRPWRWLLVSVLLVALAELDESESKNGEDATEEGNIEQKWITIHHPDRGP